MGGAYEVNAIKTAPQAQGENCDAATQHYRLVHFTRSMRNDGARSRIAQMIAMKFPTTQPTNPATQRSESPDRSDAESLIQRQLDAYNAHDLEGLLATYAADAKLYDHPATLLASGADQLRSRFTARFQEPNLHGPTKPQR